MYLPARFLSSKFPCHAEGRSETPPYSLSRLSNSTLHTQRAFLRSTLPHMCLHLQTSQFPDHALSSFGINLRSDRRLTKCELRSHRPDHWSIPLDKNRPSLLSRGLSRALNLRATILRMFRHCSTRISLFPQVFRSRTSPHRRLR